MPKSLYCEKKNSTQVDLNLKGFKQKRSLLKDQIRIQVLYTPINPSDINVMEGSLDTALINSDVYNCIALKGDAYFSICVGVKTV